MKFSSPILNPTRALTRILKYTLVNPLLDDKKILQRLVIAWITTVWTLFAIVVKIINLKISLQNVYQKHQKY